MKDLFLQVAEHAGYVLGFVAIIIAAFVIAIAFEKYAKKLSGDTDKILTTRKIVVIGIFSAIAVVLMFFEFSVPFAPHFYKIGFSDLPALVGGFAFGPVAGVMIEFVKILLNLLFQGTSTAFVGELANFLIGCSYILPGSVFYLFKKNKKTAILSCVLGTLVMTVFGCLFNAFYLLPAYALLYGGIPVSSLIEAGTAVNSHITNMFTFVVLAVAPLNLLKGTLVSVVTMLVYKPLSPIIKFGQVSVNKKKNAIADND